MRTPEQPDQERVLDAFTSLVRDGVEPRSPTELDDGLNSLLARLAAGRVQRRGRLRWTLVGVTALVCWFGVMQLASSYRTHWRRPAPPALAYQIENGSVLEAGYLRASGDEAIKVRFNEGTTVALSSGTRGRLRAVDPTGARIAIEQGTAAFRVTPSQERQWLVEVGPFVVTVKGTVFTVSWDSASERFELRLRSGRVVVSGPVSGGDIVLRTGQRLVVNLPKAETLILDDTPDDSFVGPVVAPTPAVASPPIPNLLPSRARDDSTGASAASASLPATTGTRETARRWAHELANGHWDRILAEVERTGLDTALERVGSEDLYALANAARYRRRTDLARAALLAERRRFPGSQRALDALFLLGRVEESGEQGAVRAIAWYADYLSRAPKGAYASEALGRTMTLTNELEGAAEARPIADDYVRRFPKGSYAGSARALLRGQ